MPLRLIVVTTCFSSPVMEKRLTAAGRFVPFLTTAGA